MPSPILIIGATGMLGRPVTRRLVAEGFPVRVLARDPARAARLLPAPCEIVAGDVLDDRSLQSAVAGAEAVYINLAAPKSPRRPDVEQSGTPRIIKAARRAGVRRLLKISFMGVPAARDLWWQIRHKAESDAAVAGSGIDHTIFLPTWFMESLLLMRAGRRLLPPRLPGVAVYWISGDDYARQVAAALRTDRSRGRAYVVQGPEAVTFRDAAARFGSACSPPMPVRQVPLWALRPVAPLVPTVRYLLDLLKVTAATNTAFEAAETWADLGEPTMRVEDYAASAATIAP